MSLEPNTPPPPRLGDILVRAKKIAPHQLGVALSVQQKMRQPLGRILVEVRAISRFTLWWALAKQTFLKLQQGQLSGPRKIKLYGADLMAKGRELLDRHLKQTEATDEASEAVVKVRETVRLRAERARLKPREVARIIEKDRDLKQRLLSGNF